MKQKCNMIISSNCTSKQRQNSTVMGEQILKKLCKIYCYQKQNFYFFTISKNTTNRLKQTLNGTTNIQ